MWCLVRLLVQPQDPGSVVICVLCGSVSFRGFFFQFLKGGHCRGRGSFDFASVPADGFDVGLAVDQQTVKSAFAVSFCVFAVNGKAATLGFSGSSWLFFFILCPPAVKYVGCDGRKASSLGLW